MSPPLPLELIDHIAALINRLPHNEHRRRQHSLGVMSLVCHAWVPIARRYLCEEIWMDVSKLKRFIAVGGAALPHPLANYVRSVLLYLPESDDEINEKGMAKRLPMKALERLLVKLLYLRKLSMDHFPFVVDARAISDVSVPRHSIQELKISFGRWDRNFEDTVAALNLFTEVEQLTMSAPNWHADFAKDPKHVWTLKKSDVPPESWWNGVQLNIKIKFLRLQSSDAAESVVFLELIRRSPYVGDLQGIALNQYTVEGFVALCKLLQVGGDSISSLTLYLGGRTDSFDFWSRSASKLSSCTSLTQLTLSFSQGDWLDSRSGPDLTQSSSWSRLIVLLRSIQPTLTSLCVHFYFDTMLEGQTPLNRFTQEIDAAEGRDRLADALQGYPNLRILRFVLWTTRRGEKLPGGQPLRSIGEERIRVALSGTAMTSILGFREGWPGLMP